MLALGLFVTEIFVPAYGILTSGGIVSLVIGSLILFSGSDASMEFDKSLIIYVAIFFALFVGFLVWAAVRGQRRKVVTGKEGIIGETALVKVALEPQGMVLVEGELWKAVLDEGSAPAGEEVTVKKIVDLKLYVTRKK
jgi:membrane-bound serine protease (ClpP class)